MKKLVLFLGLLCAPVFGQNLSLPATLTSSVSSCAAPASGAQSGFARYQLPPNASSVAIALSGTWSGTVQFAGSADGINWTSINAAPLPSGSAVTSATGNGTWSVTPSGVAFVCAYVSSYSSGAVAVSMSVATAGSGGSGGGLSGMTAGQVPIAATATTATSSKALAGSGAAITTGPASSTNLDCANFTGIVGQLADSGTPCGGGYPGVTSPGSGSISGAGTASFGNVTSVNPITLKPGTFGLLGEGASNMANSTGGGGGGGSIPGGDLLTKISLGSQMKGAAFVHNSAAGGSTCANVLARETANSAWAPGGASAGAVTTTLMFVAVGTVEALWSRPLPEIQQCMKKLVDDYTHLGFTVIMLTAELQGGNTDSENAVLNEMNIWMRYQTAWHVIDVAGWVPPTYAINEMMAAGSTVNPVTGYTIYPGSGAAGTATISGGQVTTIASTSVGSGYDCSNPPIVLLTSGGTTPGTGVNASFTPTCSGGTITGYTQVSGGTGYTGIPAVILLNKAVFTVNNTIGVPISSWAIAGSGCATNVLPCVATFQNTSSTAILPGQYVTLSGFGTSTFFNGLTFQVNGTGTTFTQFAVNFPHAASSGTESGIAISDVFIDGFPTTSACLNSYYIHPLAASSTTVTAAVPCAPVASSTDAGEMAMAGVLPFPNGFHNGQTANIAIGQLINDRLGAALSGSNQMMPWDRDYFQPASGFLQVVNNPYWSVLNGAAGYAQSGKGQIVAGALPSLMNTLQGALYSNGGVSTGILLMGSDNTSYIYFPGGGGGVQITPGTGGGGFSFTGTAGHKMIGGSLVVCSASSGCPVTTTTGSVESYLATTTQGKFTLGTTGSIFNSGATTAYHSPGNNTFDQPVQAPKILTTTTCANGASPAVCGAAPDGAVAIPTGVNSTLTVNTTAVTASSQIGYWVDDSVTIGGTTCNSTLATLVGGVAITGRVPGTSFTLSFNGTITTNPVCMSYSITN